jgi:polyhydroxyalkanoate synthesis regulator phasin
MLDDLMNKVKEVATDLGAGESMNKVEDMVAGSDVVQSAMAAAKQRAADLGISSGVFDELIAKAKEMIADGKISKEEVMSEVKRLAESKGVPSGIFDILSGLFK